MTEPSMAANQDDAHALRPRARPFLDTSFADVGPEADAPAPGLRPFVMTAGRVEGANTSIGLETQVSARSDPPPVPRPRLTPELQAIVTLCAEPMSVAEISARLHLHLGVAKVLVQDLSAAGQVHVHLEDAINPNDPDTILRVIRGLRSIS